MGKRGAVPSAKSQASTVCFGPSSNASANARHRGKVGLKGEETRQREKENNRNSDLTSPSLSTLPSTP